jgi:hypothetical protein
MARLSRMQRNSRQGAAAILKLRANPIWLKSIPFRGAFARAEVTLTCAIRRTGSRVSIECNSTREDWMFFVQEGFTYRNFLMDIIAVFTFVVWFWLIIVIYGDLFRRHDISGWGKALWVIALVLFSYFAIFAYLVTQGKGMAERNAQQAQQTRDELRRIVGFSVADEIAKLDQLKKSGSINEVEYGRLRAKLV